MTRGWDNLSDYEFEGLVGDLLGAEFGVRFERFTRGRDGGIDLRHIPSGGRRPDIVQAKHYKSSTLSSLRTAVKKEAALGFAVAAGLLIDAFVVRTLLVPALIVLVGPVGGGLAAV